MKTDLILQTILLNIDLLASPAWSGNSLTEVSRRTLHHLTMDLIYELKGLGKLDAVAFRALDDELGLAYVKGGF